MATVSMDAVVGPWIGFLTRSLVQYEMSFHVLDDIVLPSRLEAMVVFAREKADNREKPDGYLTTKQATFRREW